MNKDNDGKIRRARYGGISVNYLDNLDGGGRNFGQDFIPVVKMLFGKVPRICEFGSGPGFIGFSLLAHGLCESLCLIDINPEAIRICKETIKENKLEDRVSIYLSDGLSDVPLSEKWDLVVSNPPHFKEVLPIIPPEQILRSVDPNWKIHQQFYADVGKFLKPKGSILFQENINGSTPWVQSGMIIKNGLELIDCFWYKKFNTIHNAILMYEHHKALGIIPYFKGILNEILNPSEYLYYFMWSRKTDVKQGTENL